MYSSSSSSMLLDLSYLITFDVLMSSVWPPRNPSHRGKTGTGDGRICEPSRLVFVLRTRAASADCHHSRVRTASVVVTRAASQKSNIFVFHCGALSIADSCVPRWVMK